MDLQSRCVVLQQGASYKGIEMSCGSFVGPKKHLLWGANEFFHFWAAGRVRLVRSDGKLPVASPRSEGDSELGLGLCDILERGGTPPVFTKKWN